MTLNLRYKLLTPVLLAVLALVSPLPLQGQAITGSMSIRVVDSSGAAIPNAEIKLLNEDKSFERSQVTSDEGLATFVGLAPGKYRIEVNAANFKRLMVENVIVGVSRSEVLNLTMEIGATDQAVTVSSGGAVDDDLLEALPNINKDLSSLVQLLPGASAANPAALGRIVTDGKGKEGQTLRLDGLDVTPLTELPTGDPTHSVLDSLLKSTVALRGSATVTHAGAITFEPPGGDEDSYAVSPLYGPGTGTLLDGISYDGSGKAPGLWKFQLSEAIRNDALNARNLFEHEGKNAFRRNQFSGRLGSPLIKGRATFFFGYDGIRARSNRPIYEAVPADAVCLCGSGPLNPYLGGFIPPGTTIVPGNISKDENFFIGRREVRASGDSNAWDARLDAGRIINPDSSITVRFTRQAAEFLIPDGITGRQLRQGVVLAHGLARLNILAGTNVHTFTLGVNQTRSYGVVETPLTTSPDLAQSLITLGSSVDVSGLPGNPPTVPRASLGGLQRGAGRGFRQSPISFNGGYDLVTRIAPKHEAEAGLELRFIRFQFDRFGGLTYTFPDRAALRSGAASSVDFTSDLSAPSPFTNALGPRHAAQEYFLSYFQIRSQWSPDFLLTYGLRYDYFGLPRERDDRAVFVDLESGTILPVGTRFFSPSKFNFQPRIGLSYQFANNSVFRAGVGLYAGVPRIGDLLLPIESDRFNINRKSGLFPVDPSELVQDFIENSDSQELRPLSFSRNFTTPERIVRWDFMLTRTFHTVNDLNIIYTGSRGSNLPVAGVANPIISVQDDPDPTRLATVRRQFDFDRDGSLFKPFGELQFRTSEGRSVFDGVTIQFKRNNRPGIDLSKHWLDWQNFVTFNAQYTLARNLGNANGTIATDTLNFDRDFGFNASHVRHLFSLSTSYKLWDNDKRDPHDIIWGWTIGTTITARSGFPIFVRLDRPEVVYADASGNIFSSPAAGRHAVINTPTGGASGASSPDLVPGVDPFLRDSFQFLNPAAFAIPAPGQFGNLKRGKLHGPGSFVVDLSFTRVLFATEGSNSVASDLKIEVTNVFNRSNLNNPVGTLQNALGTSLAGDRIQPGVPFTRLAAGPTFGVIGAADPGRQIQFSITFKFNKGF